MSSDMAMPPTRREATRSVLRMGLEGWMSFSWKAVYPLLMFWGLQSSVKGMLGIVLLLFASEWKLLQQYMMLMEKLHGEEEVKVKPKLRQLLQKRGF